MVATIKILVEGLTNADSLAETEQEKTRPTITLVRDGDVVMVADPGILDSQKTLVEALAKENLTVNDVNVVCITHSHIDHYRNIGMFPNAKTLEYYGVWDKESVENWQEQFSANIQVIRTPGHDYTGITLFVTTENGMVAVCGDIFWKLDYPKTAKDDDYALNVEELEHSREMILKLADWIVPGHGKIFKVNRVQMLAEEDGLIAPPQKETKVVLLCKKCHKQMERHDRCLCRPWLCHNCCQCGLDCDLCGCSHKREVKKNI